MAQAQPQAADIVKVSELELQLLSDSGALIPGVAKLLQMGVKIICVTQGAKGCIIATPKGINRFPAYKTKTVDTLGSGDGFFGAFLYKFLETGKSIEELDSDDIKEMAMFSNACERFAHQSRELFPQCPKRAILRRLSKLSL